MKQTTTTVSREQLIKALLAEWVWICKEDAQYHEPDPDDSPEEHLEFLNGCSYESLVEQALEDGVFTLEEFIHNWTFDFLFVHDSFTSTPSQ